MLIWNATRAEHELFKQIAERAVTLPGLAGRYPIQDAIMDINAVHANGCPLKLAELLAAPDFEFAHDICGIRRHLDRTTGKLGGCFLPRYAYDV